MKMQSYGNLFKRKRMVISDDGMTKQGHKSECDINVIMKKYLKTGLVGHASRFEGVYGDAPAIDFHSAMNVVMEGQEAFDALPSATRQRFGNDPGAFLDFVQDAGNESEMRDLGLLDPVPEPDPAPVTAPLAEPAAEPAQVST